MTTRLAQPAGYPADKAALRVRGVKISDPSAIQLSIVQVGAVERYLDPRNAESPWTTTVFRFHPLDPRIEDDEVVFDLDYGVTYHLLPNKPYKLLLHGPGGETLTEVFTGSGQLRKPTFPPSGWVPPPDPRGPIRPPQPPPPLVHAPVEKQVETPSREKAGAAPLEQESAANRTDSPSIALDRADVAETQPVPPQQDPTPVVKSKAPLFVALGIALLLIAGSLAWWLMRPTETTTAETAKKDMPASDEIEVSLDSARRFVGRDPAAEAASRLAQRFIEKKNFDGAFLLLRHAANKGDAAAAVALAKMYDPDTFSKETSALPAPNPAEAANWYKRAAEAGDAEAQYRYGMLLKSGRAEEPNGPEISLDWLRKAAAQGHAQAQAEVSK